MALSEADDSSKLCGIGSFRPKWLQSLNNPKVMCTLLSLYMFLHGFVILGVHNVNITSFERRFHLSSVEVGWAASANDISAAILGTVISFFGATRYKARWLAFSVAVGAIGCILMGLPHFMTGPYQWGQTDERICRREGTACDDVVETGVSGYLYLIMFGLFLAGLSGATQLTVGMSFIDDSVPSNSSPLYRGIVHAMLCVGLAAGYGAGGQALTLYVDFDVTSINSEDITPQDPRWVGAWWITYFLVAFLYIFLFIAFSLFGAELPTAKSVREQRKTDMEIEVTNKLSDSVRTCNVHDSVASQITSSCDSVSTCADYSYGDNKSDLNVCRKGNAIIRNDDIVLNEIMPKEFLSGQDIDSLPNYPTDCDSIIVKNSGEEKDKHKFQEAFVAKDGGFALQQKFRSCCVQKDGQQSQVKFLSTMLKILRSPVFVFLTLAASCLFLALTAFTTFFPKVVQNQYNQTSARSGLLAGILVVSTLLGLILVPGAAVGQFLGGFLMNKFSLQIRGSLIMSMITTAAATPLLLILLVYCEGQTLAGLDSPYYSDERGASTNNPNFIAPCNAGCMCQLDLYEPVCDSNNMRYFSPCFAGCSTVESSANQVYSNCSCVMSNYTSESVTADDCLYGCDDFYYVLPMLFVSLVLSNCMYIPVQTALLRIHGEAEKTFSLGIMWLFIRGLGQIPGPIILGAVLDATCLVWGETCRHDVMSCWVYDNKLVGIYLSIFAISMCLGTLLMLALAYIFYQRSVQIPVYVKDTIPKDT